MTWRWVIIAHTRKMTMVHGMVNAQYIQNFLCKTPGWFHCMRGMEKNAAKKVAGRNSMVITATVFMAPLSR